MDQGIYKEPGQKLQSRDEQVIETSENLNLDEDDRTITQLWFFPPAAKAFPRRTQGGPSKILELAKHKLPQLKVWLLHLLGAQHHQYP